MPEMDGISFCRKLKHHSIKKIMLTGNSNQATAIEAFNEGIIDYFLLKDAPDLMQQLTNAIEKMQATYFRTWMERKICEQLKIRFPFPNEHAQVSFYKKWMQIVAANEFYILDNWGSALFIKKDGTPITLVVSPEMLLDFYADVAKDHEEFEIAHSLLRREQLLFFPKERYTLQPVSTWKSFLFTAHPFAEQPGWFYSLIQKEHQQPLSKQEIQTYPKIQRPN
jgi:YesN/AraC family two-component response regulator